MLTKILKKNIRHFWNEESGLTGMFVLLCISNFLIIPFFTRENTIIYFIIRAIWFILLLTGITTLSENDTRMKRMLIIPVLLLAASISRPFVGNTVLDYIEFLIMLAVFALLIIMVLVKVFENGAITMHRVIGSILAYMLIGNAWAHIFQFLFIQIPGSLQVPDTFPAGAVPNSIFLYFSFTTLTTTGYGDLLPAHAISRTLVIIEQLIGVLYPVVLIGRLVSLVSDQPGQNTKKT